VGAALIGLAEGQVIAWETWAGTERMLMVLKVHARQAQ
jgi:transcription elongation GreA/GreB family factor